MSRRYKVGSNAELVSFEDAQAIIRGWIAALSEYNSFKLGLINMDVPAPDVPLGDVRPSSSGDVSFGIRVESPNGVDYFMAEVAPVVHDPAVLS